MEICWPSVGGGVVGLYREAAVVNFIKSLFSLKLPKSSFRLKYKKRLPKRRECKQNDTLRWRAAGMNGCYINL